MATRHERQEVSWREDGESRSALWLSEGRAVSPGRVVVARDDIKADVAYQMACEGTALLWRGDYQNARQLLAAMGRRTERKRGGARRRARSSSRAEEFHRNRLAVAGKARILGMLLVEVEQDGSIRLRRAPDARDAVLEAHGPLPDPALVPLRELLGMIGAHQWRRRGIRVPALGARIHPHYGVFSPIRQEYVDLVARAPLPSRELAFDAGTGTGVLAALLAHRGVSKVIATDDEPRAVACARDNIERLGLTERVLVVQADLFPDKEHAPRAPLIVLNPPWIPAKATTTLERAVYDPKGRTLQRFLNELPARLEPRGEAWLVLSDLAEILGLRRREDLLAAFERVGLRVEGRLDARPKHPRASDPSDPLHAYRRMETTSLWRLRA